MSILQEISENLQKGRSKAVCSLVETALNENYSAKDIMQSMMDGMAVIGEKFKKNEVFVPEVLISARAMNKGIALLKPHLQEADVHAAGRVCIGTVKGDLHDIGKNLVKLMLESKGLEVIDLGVDVADEAFLDTYDKNPDTKIICLSALLTTTMPAMRSAVAKINAAPWRSKVKVMVGGAPITQAFCDEIGADCYTSDAASAAEAAKKLAE